MSTEIHRVSAYKVTPHEDGSFQLADGQPFDVEAYSRIKYGDVRHAWAYGAALAESIVGELPEQTLHEKAAMTVPAYAYSPKPALAVARAALTELNTFRAQNGVQPIKLMRLHTDQMGT